MSASNLRIQNPTPPAAIMFWQMPCMLSNIDTVLDKSDVQLSEVLDDDSVIQECKSQNEKLLNYLSSKPVMDQMIDILVSEPDCALSDKVRYRHPNVCCELLTCDIELLNNALVDGDRQLDRLCNYLRQSVPPLNPLTASFVSKVLQLLARRKSKRLLAYLKALPEADFVARLVDHTATAAVVDLLLAIVTMRAEDELSVGDVTAPVDSASSTISAETSDWLIENGLVDRLLDALAGFDSVEERRYNAADCLCNLLAFCREQAAQMAQEAQNGSDVAAKSGSGHRLLDLLESRQTAERLLSASLPSSSAPDESTIVACLQVLLALLDDPDFVGGGSGGGVGGGMGGDVEVLLASELDGDRLGGGGGGGLAASASFGSPANQQQERLQQQQLHRLTPERLAGVAASMLSALLEASSSSGNRLVGLIGLLESPPASLRWPSMPNTAGPPFEPPFGRPRLLIGRLVLRLLQLLLGDVLVDGQNDRLTEALLASAALPRLFNLALAYPWCSFAHQLAERCCSIALLAKPVCFYDKISSPQCRLARQLLIEHRLAERLINACRCFAGPGVPGYRGHLVRLANCINSNCCLPDWPDELTGKADDQLITNWREFVDKDLAELNSLATVSSSSVPNAAAGPTAGAVAPPPSLSMPLGVASAVTSSMSFSTTATSSSNKNDTDNDVEDDDDEINRIRERDSDSDDEEEDEKGIGPAFIVSGAARRRQQQQQQQQQKQQEEATKEEAVEATGWADFSAFEQPFGLQQSDAGGAAAASADQGGWADFSQMN